MYQNISIPQSASLTAKNQGMIATGNHTYSDSLCEAPPVTQGGLILGITGGSGGGKTTLLDLIREKGGLVLDCDAIYHELLRSDRDMLSAIGRRFPGTVENGCLDRKKLGSLVFGDPEALADLNRITHSAVTREVLRRLEHKPALAAIDAIGLFESGLDGLCDVTVGICAPVEDRIKRLMARDGISEEYARSRIAAQHDDAWFRTRCDRILENSGGFESYQIKCLDFLEDIGII